MLNSYSSPRLQTKKAILVPRILMQMKIKSVFSGLAALQVALPG